MKLLLAVDDSPYSTIAVNAIAERPWPPGTAVRVLSVVKDIPPPATEVWMAAASIEVAQRAQQEEIKRAEQLTKSVAGSLKVAGLTVETAVHKGDPRSVIVDEAADWAADLIIVGSHGYTGIKRWLLGSVAQSVVNHAPCSVEVVREKLVNK
jgi:nucleotide-binding universal stress UspA family protein